MILPVWDSNPQTCGVDPLVSAVHCKTTTYKYIYYRSFGATMTYLQFLRGNHIQLKVVNSFSVNLTISNQH